MELAGKVVIVTGGAGNLGSVCARRLAEAGAAVVVSDLPEADVESVVDGIVKAGGTAVGHGGDVSEEDDIVAMVGTSVREYGRLDALVNVAGAIGLVRLDRDLTEMPVETWDAIMAVNARGPMLGCKHAIPAMLATGGGSIINFTSPAAFRGDDRLFAYSASKAAVIGLTLTVATAYGKQGIRCNAIAPGCVWSERYREHIPADMLDLMERVALTPRLGLPDDIAHMTVYLASDKAGYVTGQTLVVDGGLGSHQPWVGAR
ncbi:MULTISPECIES: SDR family NAD(P)-dependent oxidoreductase [unclassified Pseudofrankia]|uniref:SDR family NAD(P)-dependent oxidoreductase n=1 Tax=unclassified Pseudofrankia TaxID=2994372 RepID=UPI0008D9235C|nr:MULTISPECIES: SDR family oxidoreductase [unclassified Pseudofrankia]MDT3445778.1 SDR family oxidoreductase [Pseudofrankia sp. BMG5.37]OHV62785.1 hypothetical protein BCD48_39135 [Pseudofrankia sp. BMG5.36]